MRMRTTNELVIPRKFRCYSLVVEMDFSEGFSLHEKCFREKVLKRQDGSHARTWKGHQPVRTSLQEVSVSVRHSQEPWVGLAAGHEWVFSGLFPSGSRSPAMR